MGKTLYVPEGEQGDEAAKRIMPKLLTWCGKEHRGGRGG